MAETVYRYGPNFLCSFDVSYVENTCDFVGYDWPYKGTWIWGHIIFPKGQKINPVAAYATVSATKNLLIIGKKYN